MNTFDYLKDIISNKTGKLTDQVDFDKTFDSYMIVRYLSMDERFIDCAEIANQYVPILSKREMYKLLINIVPKNRNCFISYISKPKKKSKKELLQEQNKEEGED